MSRPVFGTEVVTLSSHQMIQVAQESNNAAIEALGQTDGWRVAVVGGGKQTKIDLWYDNDDPGQARVASLLRMLGRREGVAMQEHPSEQRPTAAEVAERIYTELAALRDPAEFTASWSELSEQDRAHEIEAVAIVMRYYGW